MRRFVSQQQRDAALNDVIKRVDAMTSGHGEVETQKVANDEKHEDVSASHIAALEETVDFLTEEKAELEKAIAAQSEYIKELFDKQILLLNQVEMQKRKHAAEKDQSENQEAEKEQTENQE